MIQCKSISKCFDQHCVFQNFNYEIRHNGIHVVTGRSGCGKTTLSRMILSLEQPDSGSIHIQNDLKFSVLFPESRLLPTATALGNITFVNPNEAQAIQLLTSVHLHDSMSLYPNELSSGMQRRIALARALAYPSDFLILDEPFSGLDDELKQIILKLIIEYSQDMPILVLSHERALLKPVATTYRNLEEEQLHVFHNE